MSEEWRPKVNATNPGSPTTAFLSLGWEQQGAVTLLNRGHSIS